MATFIITFIIFVLAATGIGLGVLAGRREIKGSCGGCGNCITGGNRHD